MYALYGAPGRASAAPEAVLEEIGVPYRYVVTEPAQASPEYLRLHPLGLVPTLTFGDFAIWEAAAICVFLAERHPEAGLFGPDMCARATAHQWLHFCSSSLQPTYMLAFYPQRYGGDDSLRAHACARLAKLWSVIHSAGGAQFLVGDRLSICDFYIAMLAAWHVELEAELAIAIPGPELARLAVLGRPSTRRMLEHNVEPAIHARLVTGYQAL